MMIKHGDYSKWSSIKRFTEEKKKRSLKNHLFF